MHCFASDFTKFSSLISGPGQRDFLAFGRNPVKRSLDDVDHNILVGGLCVRIASNALELFLC
jgi:hypothetical protein